MIVGNGIIVDCFCLSEDVVYEILLRLPSRSILKFKCVCRGWYNVIKSSRFREDHYARQSNSGLLLPPYHRLFPNTINIPREYYQFNGSQRCYRWKILSGETLTAAKNLDITVPIPSNWGRYYNITSPCRGVFLLYCIETAWRRNLSIDRHDLRLWNPMTGAFSRLPRAPPMAIRNRNYCVYALGWDPSTGNYKVVCLLYDRKVALVHTPGSGSWHLVDSPVPRIHSLIWCPPMYAHVNGFFYWQTVSSYTINNNPEWKIVFFDVAREVFATLPLPPCNIVLRAEPHGRTLCTYRNSLACLALGEEHLEVWVLEQQKQQQQPLWTKVFDFTLVRLYPNIGQVGIWNDTHLCLTIIENESLRGFETKVLLCDLNTDHVEEKDMVDNIDVTFLNYKSSLFLD